jgi:hypothetical protein
MGFGGGGGQQQAAPAAQQTAIGPYPDDNVSRMPTANSANALAAARRKRAEVIARSGRSSTKLAAASNAGTTSYTNNFLGGTN